MVLEEAFRHILLTKYFVYDFVYSCNLFSPLLALGNYDNTYINAKGDGSKFVWQVDGEAISNSDALWYPGHPGSNYDTDRCLTLQTEETKMDSYPDQPFYGNPCGYTEPYLCECE